MTSEPSPFIKFDLRFPELRIRIPAFVAGAFVHFRRLDKWAAEYGFPEKEGRRSLVVSTRVQVEKPAYYGNPIPPAPVVGPHAPLIQRQSAAIDAAKALPKLTLPPGARSARKGAATATKAEPAPE